MSRLARIIAFAFVVVAVVALTGGYALRERQEAQERGDTVPAVARTGTDTLGDRPRIVFRHTGLDESYGTVAMVSLADPDGARAFTGVACDRVAAWDEGASCLVTERGVVTRYEARQLDTDWKESSSAPLPGIPSRTRVSADGRLVATTAFVAGHSYLSTGFSTATEVREIGSEVSSGRDWGDLEDFALIIDGRPVSPLDRNIWGVTFVDDVGFYATVGTGGRTYLVEGNLDQRTLTSVTTGAECPAVSPDRTRVAFKVDVDRGRAVVWQVAVLDLASGERTLLENSARGLDDQVEWLDDDTLLYGLPRPDEPGVSDVWSVETTPDAEPEVLIEEAWSPTVVR